MSVRKQTDGTWLCECYPQGRHSNFRQLRLSGDISFVDSRWQKGKPSIATLNSGLARFKAVFSKLKELGEWKGPNPLEDIKPLKDHERADAFASTYPFATV